jgi:hypothetical protein
MVIQEAVDAAAFEFRSEVEPESLDIEEGKTNARSLIRNVRVEHRTGIKSEVRKSMGTVMNALDRRRRAVASIARFWLTAELFFALLEIV